MLKTHHGYCQMFSGAMALVLRMHGIPARVAVGFPPGKIQGSDTYIVNDHDAHAWVEVYFPGLRLAAVRADAGQPPAVGHVVLEPEFSATRPGGGIGKQFQSSAAMRHRPDRFGKKHPEGVNGRASAARARASAQGSSGIIATGGSSSHGRFLTVAPHAALAVVVACSP